MGGIKGEEFNGKEWEELQAEGWEEVNGVRGLEGERTSAKKWGSSGGMAEEGMTRRRITG